MEQGFPTQSDSQTVGLDDKRSITWRRVSTHSQTEVGNRGESFLQIAGYFSDLCYHSIPLAVNPVVPGGGC